MYVDFTQTGQTDFETDVCIIGAGAAGFSCAVSFLQSGLQVLVMEGGAKMYSRQAADLHRSEVVGHPHTGIHEARERMVGGTTTKWGGQALPFMLEDFEKRPFVEHSGWPISLKDLAPYYSKAEKVLGTDSSTYFTYSPWKDRKVKEPAFTQSKLNLFVTKWCKVPNFATQYSNKVEKSGNITLLINANAVELLPSSSLNKVNEIRIRSLDKKEGTIKAKYIIAAGGALETVRLFLASKNFGSNGLGNNNGLVGRYFQDHIATVVGQIVPASRKWFNDVFDPFYKNGYKYFPRLKINPALARKSGTLHASAQIVFSEDPNSSLSDLKLFVSALKKKEKPDFKILKKLANPRKALEAGRTAVRWKINKRGSSPFNGPVWLEVHSEQNPEPENRIELSDIRDELGMPRIRLNWEISDLTVKTIREAAKLLKDEFAHASLGEVVLEPWVYNTALNPRQWMGDVFHQAGGLRMATAEKDGVVDSSCRVFGIDNLYVASSAVFPTSSFSNPTMTTIALAVRISETVINRMVVDKTF